MSFWAGVVVGFLGTCGVVVALVVMFGGRCDRIGEDERQG